MITLLSDFGLADPYVAEMKGVILSIASGVNLVDISHEIDKHNITVGSYVLETSVPFFPNGSVHVAVVDPGVGGSRLPLVISCERGVLVGPDNGLLVRAAEKLGVRAIYQIRHNQFSREKLSSTFHGRDVFAYTAAKIALGFVPSDVGPKLSQIVRLDIPDVRLSKNGVDCCVLYVDSFGNVVTSVPETSVAGLDFRPGRAVRIAKGEAQRRFSGVVTRSYFDIPLGRIGVLLGSQGYLELALREASVAERLGVRPQDRLRIRLS